MGLFGRKEICTVCNTNESDKKLLDGGICKECIRKCYPFITTLSWKNISGEKAIKAIEVSTKNNQLLQIFQPTTKIEKYISFDANNKLWKPNMPNVVFGYDDIVSVELLEDGESITKGGLGRAVVGGALFGGAGAIVGGVTGKKKTKKEINELKIKVVTRNEMCPEVYINFLVSGSVKSNSILYKSYKGAAERTMTEFALIMDALNERKGNMNSEADEILKYKKLCDDGVITQEEFEEKKRQLLGI